MGTCQSPAVTEDSSPMPTVTNPKLAQEPIGTTLKESPLNQVSESTQKVPLDPVSSSISDDSTACTETAAVGHKASTEPMLTDKSGIGDKHNEEFGGCIENERLEVQATDAKTVTVVRVEGTSGSVDKSSDEFRVRIKKERLKVQATDKNTVTVIGIEGTDTPLRVGDVIVSVNGTASVDSIVNLIKPAPKGKSVLADTDGHLEMFVKAMHEVELELPQQGLGAAVKVLPDELKISQFSCGGFLGHYNGENKGSEIWVGHAIVQVGDIRGPRQGKALLSAIGKGKPVKIYVDRSRRDFCTHIRDSKTQK